MSQVFLTAKQIATRHGVNVATTWRRLKSDPTFPRPIKLSPGCTRWRVADIEAWEASKHDSAA